MSTEARGSVRAVAFGALEAGVWGAAWGADDPFLAVGTLAQTASPSAARIDGSDAGEDWTLCAEGLEIVLSACGDPAQLGQDGFEQLCLARGSFTLGESRHPVESLGRRAVRGPLETGRIESIRDISGWFEPRDALSLTALRPRKAKGHESDLVTAVVFEEGQPVAVADPRLSTTYGADGTPARAGLELWLADEDSEPYPRRAAAQAVGAGVRGTGEGLQQVSAQLLRWHSRGRDGTGVYLLVELA